MYLQGGYIGFRVPKILGTSLGFSRIKIIVFWVYVGVPIFRETTIASQDKFKKLMMHL